MLERQQWIGLAGVLLVAVGTFLPIADVGLWSMVTLYGHGLGDGIFVLGLDVIAVAILFARQYRWLVIVAVAIAVIFGLTGFRLSTAVPVHWMWWGWVPLVLGTASLFAAGLLPIRRD